MIAKEGLLLISVAAILSALAWTLSIKFDLLTVKVFAILFTIMFLFLLYFFRDPNRVSPNEANTAYSPADGTIVEICEELESNYVKEKMIRVSIFLSVFNVHINRFPISGTVKYMKYNPGKFLPAYRPKASELNEQTCIGFDTDKGEKIVMKQIAGIAARRIVCYAKPGDTYKTGERFGLIKLGSRTDIFLPLGTQIKVKLGQKVSGGTSIIGVLQ